MLLDSMRHRWASVRDRAIVWMLLDSGMRNSELCHLKVEDITLETGAVKIRQGKGGKDRTVLIGKRAKEAPWGWMIQRPEDAEYLYCTIQGKPINRIGLSVIVHRLGQRINIRTHPHRLRHRFALMFLKNGGAPYTLQYLLGHEDMTTIVSRASGQTPAGR